MYVCGNTSEGDWEGLLGLALIRSSRAKLCSSEVCFDAEAIFSLPLTLLINIGPVHRASTWHHSPVLLGSHPLGLSLLAVSTWHHSLVLFQGSHPLGLSLLAVSLAIPLLLCTCVLLLCIVTCPVRTCKFVNRLECFSLLLRLVCNSDNPKYWAFYCCILSRAQCIHVRL